MQATELAPGTKVADRVPLKNAIFFSEEAEVATEENFPLAFCWRGNFSCGLKAFLSA